VCLAKVLEGVFPSEHLLVLFTATNLTSPEVCPPWLWALFSIKMEDLLPELLL
jgi:hypothetical protein